MREPVTTAGAVVERLVEHGVEHIFGIPGTHNLPLYRELSRTQICHVTCRHEQNLGFAADGYTRSSGRPGVCLTTTGPALMNIVSAACNAYADSIPLLIISPALPRRLQGRDAGFLHQMRDQRGAMEAAIGRSFTAADATHAASLVDEAFASFTAQRPRPFHIEIPLEIMDIEGTLPARGASAEAGAPASVAVAEAAAVLSEARRAIVVLGGGSTHCTASAQRVCESLAAPVVTTVNGKGVLPESHPLSLGSCLRLPRCHELLRGADAVLAVGTELAESDLWTEPPIGLEGKLVRVDIDPTQLNKNEASSVALQGDSDRVLRALDERLGGARGRGGAETEALRGRLRADALADGQPYVDLIAAIRSALPADGVLAGDSAKVCYYGAVHFFSVDRPRRFIYPTGFATLGYGLPAAIGAKLAEPERDVVALMGDGGVMYSIAELATAVELRLPIVLIISDNAGYGEIRDEMDAEGQPRIGVNLQPPDFVSVAKAFGAHAQRVNDLALLRDVVAQALKGDRPTVLEVVESSRGRAPATGSA